MKLDPGEKLLIASRPHPALLIPALLRALAVLLAAAVVLVLLRRSSAPGSVRVALDLPVIALAGRAVLRFARAVWQWDRSLLALTLCFSAAMALHVPLKTSTPLKIVKSRG